jgi:hypothetical protein
LIYELKIDSILEKNDSQLNPVTTICAKIAPFPAPRVVCGGEHPLVALDKTLITLCSRHNYTIQAQCTTILVPICVSFVKHLTIFVPFSDFKTQQHAATGRRKSRRS